MLNDVDEDTPIKERVSLGTRETILRWHPGFLRRPEPLRTECIDWLLNRWENLEINDIQLRDEVSFNIVRVKKYDNHSENWKLFHDTTHNRYIKVYSKRIWETPQFKPIHNMYKRLFFAYLNEHKVNKILPDILFMSKNYIGLEWLGTEDNWKKCEASDFISTGPDGATVTQSAINAARNLQKIHLSSCEYFKKHMQQDDYRAWRECLVAAGLDGYKPVEVISDVDINQHKLHIGSHNFWPRDFVTRINPETQTPEIRFIDFENLQINDATQNNNWYHKYKISLKSLYLQHYTPQSKINKKYQEDNEPLKSNEFIATYVFQDTTISERIVV